MGSFFAIVLLFSGLSSLPGVCLAADECQPHTWSWGKFAALNGAEPGPTPSSEPHPVATPNAAEGRAPEPGELNCRNWAQTYEPVGYWTCNLLAETYEITIEEFWAMNPELAPDCEGIKPYTKYCVSGYIEPVRSVDGNCGPNFKNATCVGTDFGQCCNAETWKCGDTEHDCSAGVCYEGSCPGHKVYTTDGTCGYQHSYSRCVPKFGDCCSLSAGKCGTGPDFCGEGKCQAGNCTEFVNP